MPRYLLATRPLIDLVRRRPGPVAGWLDTLTVADDELYVSVISIGQIQEAIDRMPSTDIGKSLWQRHFDEAMKEFRPHFIRDVDEPVVRRWATLRSLDLPTDTADRRTKKPVDLAVDSRLLLATALHEGLTLVDAEQPYHALLAKLGLRTYDPYTNTTLS